MFYNIALCFTTISYGRKRLNNIKHCHNHKLGQTIKPLSTRFKKRVHYKPEGNLLKYRSIYWIGPSLAKHPQLV